MRVPILALTLGLASPAFAQPAPIAQSGPELSGFVGVDYLGNDVAFGGDFMRERYVGTSPVLGVRVGYVHSLGGDEHVTHFALGAEAEGAFTPTYTLSGEQTDAATSYFAPYLGYRGHAILRLGDDRFEAHVLVGGGALTVFSKAPFINTQTAGQVYFGAGAGVRVAGVGIVRLDVRDAYMEAMTSGVTPTFEVQLGLTRTFGSTSSSSPPSPPVEEPPVSIVDDPPPPKDTDGDGVPDAIDKCPFEPQTGKGENGCPERDSDHDGIVDSKDACPNDPEDFDGFQDQDGCPDLDNDNDGIPDSMDACPNDPETYNGFRDDDGCPDEVPPEVQQALVTASTVTFEPGKPKLVKASRAALKPLIDAMQKAPSLRVAITGHPDKAGDAAAGLAKKRAESVRFYLEDQGISVVRDDIVVGAIAAKGGPAVDFALVVVRPKPIISPGPEHPGSAAGTLP